MNNYNFRALHVLHSRLGENIDHHYVALEIDDNKPRGYKINVISVDFGTEFEYITINNHNFRALHVIHSRLDISIFDIFIPIPLN